MPITSKTYDDLQLEEPLFRKGLNAVLTPINTAFNILDTPGSVVRGALAGQSLGQIVDAVFDVEKRSSGREVLTNLGLDPEAGKVAGFDVAGIASEILFDPLIFATGGLTKVGKASTRISSAIKDLELANSIITESTPRILDAAQSIVKSNLLSKGVAPEAINIIERHPNFSSVVTKTAERLKQSDTVLQDALSKKRYSEDVINALTIDGYKPLAGTRKERILEGQSGVEFGIGKWKYAPKLLNEAIGPAAAKVGDLLESGTKFLSAKTRLVKELVSTKKSEPLLNLFNETNKDIASRTIAEFSEDPLLTAAFKQAQKQSNLDEEAFSKLVLEGQENYNVLQSADDYFNGFRDSNLKLINTKAEEISKKYNGLLGQLPPDAGPEDIGKIVREYDKALKHSKTVILRRIDRTFNKVQSVKNRAIRNAGAINQAGHLTKDLVKQLAIRQSERLQLLKSSDIAISQLSDWGTSYARRVLTPEGREFVGSDNSPIYRFVNNYISTKTGFSNKRKFKLMTTAEANEFARQKYKIDFDLFQTDPRVADREYKYFMNQAVQRARNTNIAIEKLAQPIGVLTKTNPGEKVVHIGQVLKDSNLLGYKNVHWGTNTSVEDIIKRLNKTNHDWYVTEEVYKDLTKANKFQEGSFKKILDLVDTVNLTYRIGITTLPQHTGTNFLGNTWSNIIAGVNFAPQFVKDVATTFHRNFKKVTDFNDKIVIGTSKFDDFFKEYQKIGGSRLNSITDVIEDFHKIEGKVARKIVDSKVVKYSRAVNEYVEEASKFHHYVSKRMEGLSPIEARRSVTKYLFDYGDLTDFEKKVGKRFFLFYTFMRKNLPLAVSETFVNRRAYTIEKLSVASLRNEDFAPDYVKEQGQIALGGGEFLDVKIPLFEANRFSPQGSGLQRVIEKVMSQSSPLYKIPTELFTGRETFRGRPLEDLNVVKPSIGSALEKLNLATKVDTRSGEQYRVNSTLLNIGKNLPTARITSTIDDLVDPDVAFLPSVFGIRARNINPEKARIQATLNELNRQIEDNPEIRTFKQPFSISKNPSEATRKLLDTLRQTNTQYRELLRQ